MPPAPLGEARALAAVPLPLPRPADLGGVGAPPLAQAVSRRPVRRQKTAVAVPAPDTRSFFERLFDVAPSAAPPVAYAALDTRPLEVAPRRLVPEPAPAPATGGGTAVYDISARTVTLPNGERLEAHSGLGEKLDDPNFVHMRMRGATPPGTYDLTEREALFHGVRALRLHPVGGSAAVHGRAGLLTHTFMLGPNGDSNGCVSFRDYDRFLQAYLKGEVRRLVVVAGEGRPGSVQRFFGLNRSAASPDKAS